MPGSVRVCATGGAAAGRSLRVAGFLAFAASLAGAPGLLLGADFFGATAVGAGLLAAGAAEPGFAGAASAARLSLGRTAQVIRRPAAQRRTGCMLADLAVLTNQVKSLAIQRHTL